MSANVVGPCSSSESGEQVAPVDCATGSLMG